MEEREEKGERRFHIGDRIRFKGIDWGKVIAGRTGKIIAESSPEYYASDYSSHHPASQPGWSVRLDEGRGGNMTNPFDAFLPFSMEHDADLIAKHIEAFDLYDKLREEDP